MAKQANTETATGIVFKPTKPASSARFINPKTLKLEGFTGVVVQGRYMGRTDKNQYDKQDFRIESITEKAEDGSPVLVVINESGNLASRMSGVNIGDLIQVRYEGQNAIASGKWKGKLAHQFEVDRAE